MATRNIVPRADGEGEIGTTSKKWLKGWFDDVDVTTNIVVGGTVDGVDISTHGALNIHTAVADESSDTSCYVAFFTADTGDLAPKTGTNLTFNSSTGILTATGFAGDITGNVTGNTSGSAGSCTGESATVATIAGLAPDTATTQATQGNITSLGTLTTLTVDNITINGAVITSDTAAISFDNENLTTTGTMSTGALTCTTINTGTGARELDQNVTSGSTPTFSANNFSDGGSNAIVTTTQETNWDNHLIDNSQAHSDYLINTGDTIAGVLTPEASGTRNLGSVTLAFDNAYFDKVNLEADPITPLQAVTKQYVDALENDKSFFIESPVAGSDYPIHRFNEAVTLTKTVYAIGGTTNWVGQIQETTDAQGTGATDTQAADSTVTGTTTVTVYSNASIAAGSYVFLKTTSVSGTPDWIHVSFYYTRDV